MPIGKLAYVIECQTNEFLTVSTFPCADIAGSFYQPVIVQSYLIDPSQQSYFDGLSQGFDYVVAGQFFVFGFSGIIMLWWVGIVGGRIIKAIWG